MQYRTTSERLDHQVFADILRKLVQDLPVPAVTLLSNACQLRKYAAGDLIIKEGETSNGIFLLIVGTVQPSLSKVSEKRTVSLATVSAPAVLGVAGSMLGEASALTISALGSVETAFIPQMEFGSILRQLPQAGLAFSRLLAEELTSTYSHLSQLRSVSRLGSASAQAI